MEFKFILIIMDPCNKIPSADFQNPVRPRTCSTSRREHHPPSPPPGGTVHASRPADAAPADAVDILLPSDRPDRPWAKVAAAGGRALTLIQAA
jgi:hypothetical protein